MGTQLKAAAKDVDPEMLENLDMISTLDLMKDDGNWEALEVVPEKAYENSKETREVLDDDKEEK